MTGVWRMLFYAAVRFGGAMYLLLAVLFVLGVFGIPDFGHRKKALLWGTAAVLGTGVWRIMWLGSIDGRSTRYYVFTAVVAIFLLPLGIQGAIRVGKWCRLDRLPLKAAHWWTLLVVAVLAGQAVPELYPKDRKHFLFQVADDVAAYCNAHPGRVEFYDGTCEFYRLKLPPQVVVVAAGKIRLESDSKSGDALLKLLKGKGAADSSRLLLLRQPPDHATEKTLNEKLDLRKIRDYRFRKNVYSLYVIEVVKL